MWHSLKCSIWEQYLIRALSKHLLKQVLLNGKGHWKEKIFYKTWISRWDQKQIGCYSFVNIWYVGVYKDLSDISTWEILSIEKFSFFWGRYIAKEILSQANKVSHCHWYAWSSAEENQKTVSDVLQDLKSKISDKLFSIMCNGIMKEKEEH